MNKFLAERRLVFLLLLTQATLMLPLSHAQSQVAEATSAKVVILNFNAAVLQTEEAKGSMSALETKFAPRQGQVLTLNSEVESLRKQLGAVSEKLEDAERARREQALNIKERQLQRQADDLKTDSQGESQQAFQNVAQKVFAFLQQYAKEHGYTAVIERGSDAQPIVWYAANNLDITDELAKAYDAQRGTASAPAKALGTHP